MDFFLVKKFEHPSLPKDTTKFKRDCYVRIFSKSSKPQVNFKLKIQCANLSFEDQLLTIGLSNGRMLQFENKNGDQKVFIFHSPNIL